MLVDLAVRCRPTTVLFLAARFFIRSPVLVFSLGSRGLLSFSAAGSSPVQQKPPLARFPCLDLASPPPDLSPA
jgi:hypothetical protein